MWTAAKNLASAIPFRDRELVSLVGGGGKSALLFALAEDLRSAGRRVITSTTTKIRLSEALRAPAAVFRRSEPKWREKVLDRLEREGHLFLGEEILESKKVEGIDPRLLDSIYQEGAAEFVIVEADGAAGRPVKVPAPHEPVIPACTTMTIAVMGLEALGKAFSADLVFRGDLFEQVTGLPPGGTLSPRVLAKALLGPRGLFKGTPPSAVRVVFLNKLDLLHEREGAFDFAESLLSGRGRLWRVVVGSITTKEYLTVG